MDGMRSLQLTRGDADDATAGWRRGMARQERAQVLRQPDACRWRSQAIRYKQVRGARAPVRTTGRGRLH